MRCRDPKEKGVVGKLQLHLELLFGGVYSVRCLCHMPAHPGRMCSMKDKRQIERLKNTVSSDALLALADGVWSLALPQNQLEFSVIRNLLSPLLATPKPAVDRFKWKMLQCLKAELLFRQIWEGFSGTGPLIPIVTSIAVRSMQREEHNCVSRIAFSKAEKEIRNVFLRRN